MMDAKEMSGWYSSEEFEREYTYGGDDLGAVWTPVKTTFRVWAPTAQKVWLNLYENGDDSTRLNERAAFYPGKNGTWTVKIPGDLHGMYYTFSVLVDGGERETCDPYARAVGINGKRAMVIDLSSTDPAGWENDRGPSVLPCEAVIYEAHIRDLTVDVSSGVKFRGKYLGLAESGTKNGAGSGTCLDYIADLGVTHIHLLPIFDFASVDETAENDYNWGYDPSNYFVPEGSYSTDPYNGEVRIREAKRMIQSFHRRGIGVILDVVFNHVFDADTFCFSQIVPSFFSRTDENGTLSNGSFCGNDTASERIMVRNYIVSNVLYWMVEYHIDGFRFDLAGLLDTDTINAIVERVRAVNPNVLLYGEGWDMPTKPTKSGVTLATQMNSWRTPGFAFFNDTIRNLLRGRNSVSEERGLANGAQIPGDALKSCLMGLPYWAGSPTQVVNYVSCHDDMTLYDKLSVADPSASSAELIRSCRFAAAVVFAAAGIPFFPAGEEFLRRKLNPDGTINADSYNAGDCVNAIQWKCLEDRECRNTRDYYKGLIAFRKAHPALRLSTVSEVRKRFRFQDVQGGGGVVLFIDGSDIPEESDLYLIFNPDRESMAVRLPDVVWEICVTGEIAGTEGIGAVQDLVTVQPVSCCFLVKRKAE